MKHLRDILEAVKDLPHHGRDKAEGEKQWKKKHTDNIDDREYPAKGTDDVLNARKAKKDHSKKADLSKDEEKTAYEEYSTAEDIIEQLLDMAEVDADQSFSLMSEEEVMIAPNLAEHLVYVIDQLDEANREDFIELLLRDEESFAKMVEFALGVE
jgi:hypothetical protein|tara:strand:- start:65 stop:529 length:465 start_codon:yes stop_codon:yes gene_type:complete